MSTIPATQRRPMKTRDKIKYMFATFLAVMTIIAIGGLMLAKHNRQKYDAENQRQVNQTLSIYGQNGALPEVVELPDSAQAANAAP